MDCYIHTTLPVIEIYWPEYQQYKVQLVCRVIVCTARYQSISGRDEGEEDCSESGNSRRGAKGHSAHGEAGRGAGRRFFTDAGIVAAVNT